MVELSTTGDGDTPDDSVDYMKTIITLSMSRILKKRKVLGDEYFIRKIIAGTFSHLQFSAFFQAFISTFSTTIPNSARMLC